MSPIDVLLAVIATVWLWLFGMLLPGDIGAADELEHRRDETGARYLARGLAWAVRHGAGGWVWMAGAPPRLAGAAAGACLSAWVWLTKPPEQYEECEDD